MSKLKRHGEFIQLERDMGPPVWVRLSAIDVLNMRTAKRSGTEIWTHGGQHFFTKLPIHEVLAAITWSNPKPDS